MQIVSLGAIFIYDELDLRKLNFVLPICLLLGIVIVFYTNTDNKIIKDIGKGLLLASLSSIGMVFISFIIVMFFI